MACAEIILSIIAKGVLDKIASLTFSEISMVRGVNKEMEKFKKTLSSIKAVLSDAEEQQVKNHTVQDWLEKLKDVVYDVDDVLDEISTEVLRQKVETHGSILKQVDNFFSHSNPVAFSFKISRKIKDIRERLDDIVLERRNFHFKEQVVDAQVQNKVREQSHSFMRESDVIGRDYDKDKIVELLLSSSDHESLSVIPIVGLGGLGKTTLVKLVYNDERIVRNFELRLWVCVSQEFDLKKLLEKIIKSGTGANCGYLELDQLQTCLRDNLNAKKFLIILDDVWNDDPTKWIELRNLLSDGANGSKIIVTTRSTVVASIMGTTQSYNLKGLSNDECLSILVKFAFKEGDAKRYPKLVDIGKAIVTKCGGIPLAVRTLGCLLYMKIEEREWLYIKDNEIWKLEQKENDILPALRLSYEQMPSYLKQCFVYCSIFPKDCEIGRVQLITLWMAQGFLLPNGSRQQLEDIGNQYFNELLSRSFFHEVNEKFDAEVLMCKMHNLVHDLAQLMASTEYLNVDFNSRLVSERVRHVSFIEYDLYEKEFPMPMLNAKKLRSFSFSYQVGPISKSFLYTLILHFRCLRVLDMGGAEFEELPSFIGKLKHLRYLNLSWNRSLKVLPNSICKLLNLRTLHLYGCEQLRELPRDIGKLISLRHLYLTSQSIGLPEKMFEGLTSLRYLWFQRCNRLVSLSEGIQHLTSIRRLRMEECHSLASLPSGIKHLTALEKFWITDCQELNLLEGEDMKGLKSLQSLAIVGLPKLVALPQGLQQSAATLQYLTIQNCQGLKTLPKWLEDLTSLRRLYIRNCPTLMCLPQGVHRLTALQQLSIRGCPQLSVRCERETGEDWPNISHILEIYLDSVKIK
ncbi:hypothetical protein L1049_007781 [Liquidambar formosana]|uniref:Uncharacterized protein n=1 Tax=Liquidambar formosana TaxID=63359 RepID=A0AAP0S2E3_LIQFO